MIERHKHAADTPIRGLPAEALREFVLGKTSLLVSYHDELTQELFSRRMARVAQATNSNCARSTASPKHYRANARMLEALVAAGDDVTRMRVIRAAGRNPVGTRPLLDVLRRNVVRLRYD